MAFNQNKPAANGALTSAEIRSNFQHLKAAIAKEHNWSDTDANAVTHKNGRQVFTASGTFTVPSGVTKVYVTLCGGGGGGGAGKYYVSGGGGGGAGTRLSYPVTVTPLSTVDVTVGAGGAGGIGASNTAATAGGASSFGLVSVAGGGAGSVGNNTGGMSGATGGAGGAAGGFFSTKGDEGIATTGLNGVCGGETVFGAGGAAGAGSSGGGAGQGFGSGGGSSGGTNSSSVYRNGGAGAPGMVMVEWFN